MNYLTFDHNNQKSWMDIEPELAIPLEVKNRLGDVDKIPLKEPCILNTTDPKLNYLIGSMGSELDMIRMNYDELCRPDYEKFDYNIANENNKAISDVGLKIDHVPPMSFFAIDNIEDGIAWYQERYPEMPDLVIETCARERWGKIPKNRGEIRAEKKQRKKEDKKSKGLEIKKGEIKVDFD